MPTAGFRQGETGLRRESVGYFIHHFYWRSRPTQRATKEQLVRNHAVPLGSRWRAGRRRTHRIEADLDSGETKATHTGGRAPLPNSPCQGRAAPPNPFSPSLLFSSLRLGSRPSRAPDHAYICASEAAEIIVSEAPELLWMTPPSVRLCGWSPSTERGETISTDCRISSGETGSMESIRCPLRPYWPPVASSGCLRNDLGG